MIIIKGLGFKNMKNYHLTIRTSDPKIIGIKNGGSQSKIDRAGFISKENYDKYFNYFHNKESNHYWDILGKLILRV
jgi:hypothetical protein